MKGKLQLHPVSVLVGAAVVALAGLMVSMTPQYQLVPDQLPLPGIRIAGAVSVHGIPQGADMVTIREGAPYVVPPDKVLVMTGLASSTSVGEVGTVLLLRIGGSESLKAVNVAPGMLTIPPGLTAPAGAEVTITQNQIDDSSLGVALGYLANAP